MRRPWRAAPLPLEVRRALERAERTANLAPSVPAPVRAWEDARLRR